MKKIILGLVVLFFASNIFAKDNYRYLDVSNIVDNFENLKDQLVCVPGRLTTENGVNVIFDNFNDKKLLEVIVLTTNKQKEIAKRCTLPKLWRISLCGELREDEQNHKELILISFKKHVYIK